MKSELAITLLVVIISISLYLMQSALELFGNDQLNQWVAKHYDWIMRFTIGLSWGLAFLVYKWLLAVL